MDDAAAWCVLAVLLASSRGAPMIAVAAIGEASLYTLVVLLALRPALRPLGRQVEQRGAMSHQMLGFVLTLAMLGSWFTDWIGIYAVFGAFVLGTAMPCGRFADEVQRLLAPLTVGLLLPLFFVYSGLNTRIGLVNTWSLAGVAAIILLAACVARRCRAGWRRGSAASQGQQAMAIGALMNARGLIELIILNIGYERGIITRRPFSRSW